MSNLKKALVFYLLADAGVIAEVGSRIYHLQAEQKAARPYLIIEIDDVRQHKAMGGNTGLKHVTFGITVWGDTAPTVDAAAEAVQSLLDPTQVSQVQGLIGDTGKQINVRRLHSDGDSGSKTPPVSGENLPKFARELDYKMDFREA